MGKGYEDTVGTNMNLVLDKKSDYWLVQIRGYLPARYGDAHLEWQHLGDRVKNISR